MDYNEEKTNRIDGTYNVPEAILFFFERRIVVDSEEFDTAVKKLSIAGIAAGALYYNLIAKETNRNEEAYLMKDLQDSGARRVFETGAVRDICEGKGRADLLPLRMSLPP